MLTVCVSSTGGSADQRAAGRAHHLPEERERSAADGAPEQGP